MTNDWQDKLDRAIDRRYEEIVSVRRHLHSHPEPSNQEHETSLYLYQLLGDHGFEVQMGPEGRGVVADWPNGRITPRVAIRADIDALKIHDQKEVSYRSQNPGIMHACGHDAHTAIVYGTLLALEEVADEGDLPWPVFVRGIFQPSEETATGAREMIAAGFLDGIDAIFATHMDPTRAVGRIGLRPGVLTANCDSMQLTINGVGSHAARPHESNDAIAAAAQLISTLYLFVPRATDSQDAVVVTIGQVSGGDNPNVIPETVELRGTLRTLNQDVRERTVQHVRQLARGIEEVSGTKIDVRFDVSMGSIHNDPKLTALVDEAIRSVVGENNLERIPRPSMGSEDFASYLEQIPGVMFRVGCATDLATSSGLHTPTFDIDEEALRIGARILSGGRSMFGPGVTRGGEPISDDSCSSPNPEIRLEIVMMKITFNSNSESTLGVELELGLVDQDTMALSNSVGEVLAQLPTSDENCFKPELMQSCLEINTCVCHTVSEAEADLRRKICQVESITDQQGLRLWWGATHPFSLWEDQRVTPDERYNQLVNLLQEMARRLITFGLHVHVGVDSGDKAVMICDRIMRHLPTLLALTSSSPYWEARNTGLYSVRSKIMEGLPTAGLPTLMRNWSEYVWLVNHMVETGFINTIREIWWDVRPHYDFGTVEVRVCDMPGNLQDVMAISALVQCLVKALSDDIDQGAYQHDCHPMMVRQNKWRAARFGPRAELVDAFTHRVQPVPVVVEQLIETLRDAADELGCNTYLTDCLNMASRTSWAEQQMDILNETGDPREIVRQLSEQSRITEPQATPGS